MARWKLRTKHYLNILGVNWEYMEMDQATKRAKRRQYPVPMFLDPEDPADQNYVGMIIVALGNVPEDSQDYVVADGFRPTPDMEPLDDEAKAISAAEAKNWIHPIDSLAPNYSASLLTNFETQLNEAIKRSGLPPAQSAAGVSTEEFSTLKAQLAELMAQNKALMEQLQKPADVRRL